MNAYLVDDEPLAIERLARLLAEFAGVRIAGSATDPAAALEFLARHSMDVLFLDIQMPAMNGFELLARLAAQPPVIFTTAYDQYALKAFEVNSIDYLLKPVDPEQLQRAVRKLERFSAGARPDWMRHPDLPQWLGELGASLRAPAYPERISSRLGERVYVIELAQVSHFLAQDKLTYALAGGRSYAVDYSIADLERKLDPRKFVRIHRSILLNLDWADQLDSHFGGRTTVLLKDGNRTELPVSRDRVRALKDSLEI